jgi:hypothetical protein
MDQPPDAGSRTAKSLVAKVLTRVPELTDALVRLIEEQNSGYRRVGVVARDDLWRSCHDNITRVLQLIATAAGDGSTLEGTQPYDAARATGRHRAEQRMPLDDVLRSFRLGGRLIWETLIEHARADGEADPADLVDMATWVWQVVDATSAQVATAYHQTERELVRADEQRRATLWEGLLHGRAKDLAFALEAARIIEVPVDGPYAVAAIDVDTGDDRTGPALAARMAAARITSAWQVRTNTLVGLLSLGAVALEHAHAVLRKHVTSPAGLSLVVSGLADTDTAYRQAMLARNTVIPGRVEVAAMAERLPEALLLSSPELAGHLISRRLGPLLKVPFAERRLLLDTLGAWLATGGSISRTADAAHCHRNTVINRMRRIESITGQDLEDPASTIELSLALRASWLLPPGPLA